MLLGNHEATRMLGDLRLTAPGEYAAFATRRLASRCAKEYLKIAQPARQVRSRASLQQTPLGLVELRQAFGRDGEYGRWLRQLPVEIKINGFVFVHGGISPAVRAAGLRGINEQVRRDLTNDLDKTRAAPLASLAGRVDGPLWYRGLAQEPDAFAPQVDDILAKLRGARDRRRSYGRDDRDVSRRASTAVSFRLTPGCSRLTCQDGRASALEIRGGEATAIYVDRRDQIDLPKREGTMQEVGANRLRGTVISPIPPTQPSPDVAPVYFFGAPAALLVIVTVAACIVPPMS